MITTSTSLYHWNYFLAIEKDLANIFRYIEFSRENFQVYNKLVYVNPVSPKNNK
jgi:hypothetical protein